MDINILLALQAFREGAGDIFTKFFLKMSYIGEMTIVLGIIAEIYWCVSKEYGHYFLMGWSGNRIVNGLLKVTACAYRPFFRQREVSGSWEGFME